MITNDVLRRVRYALQLNDKKMLAIFESVDNAIDENYLHSIMQKEGEEGFVFCRDSLLSLFLDGLINEKRGKKPGPLAIPEKRLSNNIILTKLKIALNLQAEQIISLLAEVDFRISKPELSAFFRSLDQMRSS